MKKIELKILTKEFLQENIKDFIHFLYDIPNEYWEDKHFLHELNNKWIFSTIALHEDKMCAYIIASQKENKVHIHKFMVHPEMRGEGIGNMLLNFFERNCLTNSVFVITLKVYASNVKGIKFYKSHGFVTLEDNNGLLLMEKNLSNIKELDII